MVLLRNLVLFALVAEMGWAAFEWCWQIHEVMAWLSEPSATTAPAPDRRPLLAAIGELPSIRRPEPPPRRAEEAPSREISSLPSTFAAPSADESGAILEAARRYLEEHREAWNIRPYHDFRAEVNAAFGSSTVLFTAQQDGIDIEGLTINLSLSPDHAVTAISNRYRPVQRADTGGNVVDPSEALAAISAHYTPAGGTEMPTRVLALSTSRDLPELSYWLPIKDRATGRLTQGLFRASDGVFLREQLSLSLAHEITAK